MNTTELIRKKRNKENLSKEEILFLVDNYTKNKIPDYQFSALLMAVYLNGLNKEETSVLTEAMLHIGKVVNLSPNRDNAKEKQIRMIKVFIFFPYPNIVH